MRKTLHPWMVLLVVTVTGLSVLAYNLWAYCCGHCSLNTFLTLGPFGRALLALNALAALLLVALRRRRHHPARGLCRCGLCLSKAWSFCPRCGQATSEISP